MQRAAAPDHHLADPDNFRGDVTDAMDSKQRPVLSLKNQLQQTATTGNGAARRASEIRPANFIVKALFPALLFGETRARDLRHAIDR